MATFVVVVTHHRYEKARKAATDSLEKSQWPESSTIILHSDFSDALPGSLPMKIEAREGFREYKTFANIYEYAGFFMPLVAANSDDDAFLLFHDTCLAHDDFSKKVMMAADEWRSKKLDILWGSPDGQCNICIFGRKAAKKAWDMWSTWTTLDKLVAIYMEHTGNHPDSLKNATDLKQEYARVRQSEQGLKNPYGGANRRMLIFPFFDITKYYAPIKKTSDHPQAP